MTHVFVSYHDDNAALALKFAADLKNTGIPVWVDVLTLNPNQPENHESIQTEAINTCQTAIVFLSSSYASEKDTELKQLVDKKCPIIPVNIDSLSSFPSGIKHSDVIDYSAYQETLVVLQEKIIVL